MVDPRYGRNMNPNLAEYHVPVQRRHRRRSTCAFLDDPDPHVKPLGVKGPARSAITGVAAAVANAIYHATGKRIRDLPITLDKVL